MDNESALKEVAELLISMGQTYLIGGLDSNTFRANLGILGLKYGPKKAPEENIYQKYGLDVPRTEEDMIKAHKLITELEETNDEN